MSDIRFNRWLHQSGTGGVYQDGSGNIGIGTSVPSSALHIDGGQIQVGTGTTIHTSGIDLGSGTITSHSINSTGIVTASSFAGDGSSLSGVRDTYASRNIARLAVIQAEDSGSSIVNLENQFVDSFNDSAGIDTSNSSDYQRDTSNKYVVGNIDKLSGTASTDKSTVTIGSTSYNFYQVQSGVATLTVSNAPITFDVLIVGGGGGGGATYGGGGGGGLVVLGQNITLPAPGSYPMTVGVGGSCSRLRGSSPSSDFIWGGLNGQSSIFAGGTGYALTATGGGGGSGIRWDPPCSNNGQGSPGANGGGGGSRHPSCPAVPFTGGTGSKPPNISASASNIWGPTSTVTYYGGYSGGNGYFPWGEGGGGGGAGGAGVSGDASVPTYSVGGIGVSIANMAPDGGTYYWGGGGGGAGTGGYPGYASPAQSTGSSGGAGGGGGAYNYDGGGGKYGSNGGNAFNSVAPSPLGNLDGAGIKNSGGGGGGGDSPRTPGFGDMNGGPGYVLLRSTTANVGITTNMTLVGITTTAASVPTKASLIITIQNISGTTTLNTDIKGYVSRDGGTTYTQGTLTTLGTILSSNRVMVGFENLNISSQPSGSSMKYKVTTHNQAYGSKSVAVKNVSLSWS